MLQYPGFMTQYPSSATTIPASSLVPQQSQSPQNDDVLLATEESDYEDKGRGTNILRFMLHLQLNDIRKMNSNLPVVGRITVDNDKEDFDNDADDDDDGDNVEESEGGFEQETS
ncbi:hypothetical protein Dimus_023773 [Dionaea muscipula]